MLKRLIGVLAALCLGLGLSTLAPAAQAATEFSTPTACVSYRTVATCAYVTWHKQADGTGVTLDSIHVWTSQGCGDLESPAYNPVRIFWQDAAGTRGFKDSFNYGGEGCSFTHYPDDGSGNGYVGYDNGGMLLTMDMHARIDLAHDKEVYWGWDLYANGTSDRPGGLPVATDCPCS